MRLSSLMSVVGVWAAGELVEDPKVLEHAGVPTAADIKPDRRAWLRSDGVVVVAADLAGSTHLDVATPASSSYGVLSAAMGGALRLLGDERFGARFLDVRGHVVLGLYHGDDAAARAFAAALTIRTWSEVELLPRVEELGRHRPALGFRMALAQGALAVRSIAAPRTAVPQPLWAGTPLETAVACARVADRHTVTVADPLHRELLANDHVAWSCGCDGTGDPEPVRRLWRRRPPSTIDDHPILVHELAAPWCAVHGEATCAALLAGETVRDDTGPP